MMDFRGIFCVMKRKTTNYFILAQFPEMRQQKNDNQQKIGIITKKNIICLCNSPSCNGANHVVHYRQKG